MNFHEELIAHQLIVPAGVLGAFGRKRVFENVLACLDQVILDAANDDGLEFLTFPPVIDRDIVTRTGYMDSFPKLCGAVHSFVGPEPEARSLSQRIGAGQPWGELLGQTDVVLNPAACYPFYPTCTGVLPDGGRHVTMDAWVYRQEPSEEPTRMRAFRVREFVRVDTPDVALAWRDMWVERGLALLKSLGLPARADVAADPFFGRTGRILASGQLEQRLKYEVLIPVLSEENPTACGSFNYHQDKFGQAFGIRLPDASTAHSACVGFGMERIVMALFRTHGFDPQAWPLDVRARLWP